MTADELAAKLTVEEFIEWAIVFKMEAEGNEAARRKIESKRR